jgi:hypothetical protein
MIAYFKAIMIGLVLWAILNLSLFAKIAEFSIKRNSVLYIHLYYLLTHLVIGFVIGWFGKSKGWLLGLLFGIIVTMIACIIPFSESMFRTTITDIGTFGTLSRVILSPSTLTVIVCSVAGGFLGSRLRRKTYRGQTGVRNKAVNDKEA